jgi:polysaccharide export outer membrane protein
MQVRGKGPAISIIALMMLALLAGCEVDSFLDPSTVGRWEQTPVEMPILERIDVIEQRDDADLPVTRVRPQDLIPSSQEYTIGPGDLLTVSVFELVQAGQETVENRQVDQTGQIRLPVVGELHAAGKTPSQLEADIAEQLRQQDILRDPSVSVVMQRSRHNTFSILGTPNQGGTSIGTYTIPKPNFRLLDALAMARGVPGQTKTLRIFRQTALREEVSGQAPEQPTRTGEDGQPPQPAPRQPSELIDELMQPDGQPGQAQQAGDEQQPDNQPADRPAPPPEMEQSLDGEPGGQGQWVYVDGQWVRAQEDQGGSRRGRDRRAERQRAEELGQYISQRIIEVPYDDLVAGDMRYNLIIRPGDVIKVPTRNAGFVYAMGAINRPGAYSVPGENELTLKQMIASAGGLGELAVPERVDLVRRVDDRREAVVRLNVRAIFEGTQPDIFLKPNDLVNFGTNFVATPLAIFRNGLRMSYGFGFILDRNFGPDVFGDR